MSTIRDVAARANVSVATVSRVLSKNGYADPSTRDRVLQAAAELNYQRNIHWSRLKRQSSQTILYLLANRDSINSFHARLLVACEEAFQAKGFDLTFSRYLYSGETGAAAIALPRMLEQSGAVDGVLLGGVHHANLLERLDQRRIPYVMLGNDFDGPAARLDCNCVFFDDSGGIGEAIEYLVRLGHQRIAFVGNTAHPWFFRRHRAYQQAMERLQLRQRAVTADGPMINTEYGQRAAAELLAGSEVPTAIVAGNDELAAGVWKELTRRKVGIPERISLIGCGDRPEFAILEPALTSISVFVDQLGQRLAAMLLRRINDPACTPPSETYSCKLVERASCAAPGSKSAC
jgi:DNA-binding LacI/PurR family transcriptional regulator